MSHDVGHDQLALIRIEGLHSNKCEKAIQRALLSLQGVHEVEVDFLSGQASVLYDDGLVTVGELMTSVNDAGYRVLGMTQRATRTETSDGMQASE